MDTFLLSFIYFFKKKVFFRQSKERRYLKTPFVKDMGENIDRFRPYKVFIRAEMVKLIILKRPLRFPGYTT